MIPSWVGPLQIATAGTWAAWTRAGWLIAVLVGAALLAWQYRAVLRSVVDVIHWACDRR